jgi:[acyl-carrier-protein] S-malonyltransferase
MARIAFVFPGQGAQKAGMGRSLYEANPAAKAVLDAFEKIRPGTLRMCFEGPEDALSETSNTQPCLYAVELAAVHALAAKGLKPDACAGFSLGEVSALAASGVVDLAEGFRLVSLRGELMQQEAEKTEGAMAAVLKLEAPDVERLCAAHGVYPVNYNCPGQIAVSGEKAKMPDFLAAVKAAGGRAVPLKVKGAFHSPYMAEAAEKFRASLSAVAFRAPKGLLYSNKTGLPYGWAFADALADQIKCPVRWQAEVEHMRASGFDTFVEVGPGKTLAGLIGKIDEGAKVLSVEDAETLERAVDALC